MGFKSWILLSAFAAVSAALVGCNDPQKEKKIIGPPGGGGSAGLYKNDFPTKSDNKSNPFLNPNQQQISQQQWLQQQQQQQKNQQSPFSNQQPAGLGGNNSLPRAPSDLPPMGIGGSPAPIGGGFPGGNSGSPFGGSPSSSNPGPNLGGGIPSIPTPNNSGGFGSFGPNSNTTSRSTAPSSGFPDTTPNVNRPPEFRVGP